MKSSIACSVLACAMAVSANLYAQEGYGDLPNAADRSKVQSGFIAVPGFDRIHVVKENEGTPEAAAQWIQDPELKRVIRGGGFLSLQVRNLDIERNSIRRTTSLPNGETGVIFPFLVSVKHTQRTDWRPNLDQGTIEVKGEIVVHWDGKQVKVEVTNFDDSQSLERFGRKVLNANSSIDLNFARKVVVPVVEGYLLSQPAALNSLLSLAPPAPANIRKP